MADGPPRNGDRDEGRADGSRGDASADDRRDGGWGIDPSRDRGAATDADETASDASATDVDVSATDVDAAASDSDASATTDTEDDAPSLAAVLGASEDGPERRELVPESPSPEHAAFVVLGVLFSLFVVYRAWAVFVG